MDTKGLNPHNSATSASKEHVSTASCHEDTPSPPPATQGQRDTRTSTIVQRKKGGSRNRVLWHIINLLFLGFARKFLIRLKVYAKASSGVANENRTDEERKLDKEAIEEWRSGQQAEWDRLGTTAMLAEGMDDKDVAKAASGELTGETQKVVAVAMAVPVVISAYSTMLILLGHCIFVITLRSGNTSAPLKFSGVLSEPGFMIIAGVPIIAGVIMTLGAVLVAELMYNQSLGEFALDDDEKPYNGEHDAA
ncbi:hypothetical protein JAAARDRAFT_49547 [Jaapia argillacea MUCL 33604]|uniref:Uncharacterized protein n=1 Tax=Jaapia argillacea MUCL 33604 TaxID=933084 RepID=A0A067PRK6_9AGAM|nr:hypothetical protein JAAARDRAFT_49547 [Jaapia argillacea MUCL 33604]